MAGGSRPGVVARNRKHNVALPLLQQLREVARSELGIVGWLAQLIATQGTAGQFFRRRWHQLQQPDRPDG